jgi:hypothetical protein
LIIFSIVFLIRYWLYGRSGILAFICVVWYGSTSCIGKAVFVSLAVFIS